MTQRGNRAVAEQGFEDVLDEIEARSQSDQINSDQNDQPYENSERTPARYRSRIR
jgi:hypothetical protein